jgi:hypothetical protein
MSEMPRQQTISREDLYQQVWQKPMSRLGEQYGISGNGLKKICDRLHVPYPPRGYWAKLAAGKAVKAAPLTKPPVGTPAQATSSQSHWRTSLPRPPELDPETAQQPAEARSKTAGLTVPATLRQPHRAIAAWIRRHHDQVETDKRDRARWGWSSPLTKPFSSLERRQQRFLSTLFKEAEKLGYKVKGEAPREVSLETGRNAIKFKLRERIKQVRRRLTDEEKAGRSFSSQEWRQERTATGELVSRPFSVTDRVDRAPAHPRGRPGAALPGRIAVEQSRCSGLT